MFDTHCHLYLEPLYSNLDKIITRSRENNVNYFLDPGVDISTSKTSIEISNIYENVFSAVGVHPTSKIEEKDVGKMLFQIEEMLNHDRVVAVGEIGLDYYHLKNSLSLQKNIFEKQLLIALKNNKSIIIHSRHASDDVIKILGKLGFSNFSNRLVFHCAEPLDEILNLTIKYKYFIGIDGDVTFDKEKQEFIKKVPLENLVLETDSPLLAPTEDGKKDRKKTNYPYLLPLIASKVSEIKRVSIQKLTEETLKNSFCLFKP